MSKTEIILGIDLGTTFSAAAYVDENGRPRIIPNAEGEKTTPSVVLIENGRILVGSSAVNQAIAKKDNVVQWIKRAMGNLDYRFQGLNPIEISAEILKKLKADAELELGVPVKKAVVTCPAYFSAIEVENTQKAGELAGLDVQEIVREPTAAAVYYGVDHLKDGGRLLVCDLGGGTYDASVLALENGVFKPLTTGGDRQMGGHDWTQDLVDYAAEQLAGIFGMDPRTDPVVEQMLYDSCERIKRDFARSDQATIPCVYEGQSAQINISRDEFEVMTEWRIEQVTKWTQMAMDKCKPPLAWDQIDKILLVGGATRMRRVPEAIEKISGKKPIQTAEADVMVALGAAILAKGEYLPRGDVSGSGIKKNVKSGLTRIHFTRTCPRNLGTKIIIQDKKNIEIQNSVIIPYGTDIPTELTREDYQILRQGQPFFDIPVVEFDDMGPEVIQDTWRFECPENLPAQTLIHVKFKYDQSGRIAVEATEKFSDTRLAGERVTYEVPDLEAMERIVQNRFIIFALDVSGSMGSYGKIHRAKEGVLENARNLIDACAGGIKIGIVAFGSRADMVCELTDDIHAIKSNLSDLSTYGSTRMEDGINLAVDLLTEATAGAEREIVLVSDGMPDNPQEALDAGKNAVNSGIKLCLLGIGHQDVDENFLKSMSPSYLIIDNPEGISRAISNFLTKTAPANKAALTWL